MAARWRLAGLISPPAPLGLPSLRPVLLLGTDKAQTAAMLPDDARPLNTFIESLQQLLKCLGFLQFNTHRSSRPSFVNQLQQTHTKASRIRYRASLLVSVKYTTVPRQSDALGEPYHQP